MASARARRSSATPTSTTSRCRCFPARRRSSISSRHGHARSVRAASSGPARCSDTWTRAAPRATWRRLRRALGDGKLNFLGLSYGAHLGSAYAELYPDRIRTMALDAIANHSVSVNTLFADAAATYEDTLESLRGLVRADEQLPAARARRPRAVRQRRPAGRPAADSRPGMRGRRCRPTVTGGEIRMNALCLLLAKEGVPALGLPAWNDFANALARAEQGDASAFSTRWRRARRTSLPGWRSTAPTIPRRSSRYEDFVAKTLLGRVRGAAHAGRKRGMAGHPRLHALAGAGHVPTAQIMVRGAPPILLVGSTHDPETNYVWAHELRNQMPSAVLLTRDGDGHTSSWLKNSRTSDAIAHYLITGADTPAEHRLPRLRGEDRLRVRAGHGRIQRRGRRRSPGRSRRPRQSAWSYVSCQPPQV